MSFISYAQNHEDVMLWRALKHVQNGFYIDVGANHPSDDSVTRAFYERGWSGINIEPLSLHMAQLKADRPRDINLQVAVGVEDGEIELFDTSVRGLATASSEVAKLHLSAGLSVSSSKVALRRLDGIFSEFAPDDVHFLKIDVEGFERSVLEGMDFVRFRPWVVVVEATIPNSQEINADWEPMLLAADYRCVFFDGLNRYYIATERESLAGAFAAPPNVFDIFMSAETHRLMQCLDEAIAQRDETLALVETQRTAINLVQVQLQGLQTQLAALYASTSWKLTKPLRKVSNWVQQLRKHRAGGLAIRALAKILRMRQPVALSQVGAHAALLPSRPLAPEAMFLAHGPLAGSADHWFRLVGHVEGHYSLAIVNRGLAVALDELSQGQVVFQPWHGNKYEHPTELPLNQQAPLAAMFERLCPSPAQAVSIVHHYPLMADADPARHRLVLFFWEETAVPADTVEQLNTHFDAVLVATSFVKRVLRNSGCRLPVFVIPIGIDHLVGPNVEPIQDIKPAHGKPFRFLHVSSAFERKGVDALLLAFFEQYSSTDAVELYIKTFPNAHNHVRAQLAALRAGRSHAPKVVIDEASLDDASMLALYRSAQALVLPTRGEGFNLPAAEALAMGLPVLVTGFGAHLDFCTRATALLVPFHFSPSLSHVKSADACWVDPDIRALGAQMRQLQTEVMTNAEELAKRRQAGIDHLRPTYTWQQSARAVMQSVHWLEARRTTGAHPALRRLALLSPWMTRCGIAEYSHKLLAEIAPAYNLQVFCDSRTMPDATQSLYHPSWKIGDAESVCLTLDAIPLEPYDVLLVQHQPSLFSLTDALCERLLALHNSGCVVMLELHSTLPLLEECRMSSKALAALRNLDRILVHKREDLNHLLALGLANNVLLLPHGVVQPAETPASRSAWGIGEDELVLASFGFLLPHKGVDTLIDCIKPLARASKRRVRLLGLHSTLDSRSEEMLAKCMKQAHELGVDQQITWITDFRPIDECVQLLGMADYIVFPYRKTRESASGAVTIGVAALKPVLVSPLPIFSDLSDTTYRLTSEGVKEIVNAVCELEKAPERRQELITTQRAWLAKRNWSRVSSRLYAVMHGLLQDRQLEASVAAPRERFMAEHAKVRVAQLLVDVSELYFRDAKTGIQRVVRSILSELLATPPPGFEVRPVYGSAGQGYRYTDKFSANQAASHPNRDEKAVEVEDGDVFLGLDLSAHLFPNATAELKKFRQAGARVYFVVYDIIPLLYPQFTVAGMTAAFEVWLQSLAQEADGLVCISAAVADDVKAWLAKHAKAYVLPAVLHFHLGADIESSAPSMGLPKEAAALLEKIKQQPSFLMVGTIEPRKAQAQALAAFEQLWREGVTVQLVLVGKEGWLMKDFCQKVRAHPELGHRLLWLEGVSDEFLEQVYAAASCLLAASEAEGFGLPLIEAAQHHLPIMARDIGVFREVAGAHASYFSGLQPENLARAIGAWLALHRAGGAPSSSSMPWLTWQQSTQRLLDIVLKT